ncbi:MAG: ArsR family transcriptional regulator [Bacteroidota bacterium]|nr:ArsR family transcriptional regulator [Bacteroidota bacterium]
MLLKFFLNSRAESYLRSLEQEFGGSSNAIRIELNKFEEAGLLQSSVKGNKKMYKANVKHPLFPEIHSIVLKHVGFDKIIEDVVERLGDVKRVFLTGDFAKGKNSNIIDLILVGDDINKQNLMKLTEKAEKIINRKIRYLVFTEKDYAKYYKEVKESDALLLWQHET